MNKLLVPRLGWEPLAALALLAGTLACFLPVLSATVSLWTEGGGLENRVIALIAVIYLVTREEALLKAPLAAPAEQIAGFGFFAGALVLAQIPSLTVQCLAFCLALAALVLFRWGWFGLKRLGKPLIIVACAMTVSGLADGFLPRYTPVVQWLQHFVASVVGYMLWTVGYPVEVEQTVIRIGESGVDVNAACSGIKSLLEVGVLAVVAILSISRRDASANWRYFLICEAIVLGLNTLRILALAGATLYLGQDAFDALHEGWGASLYGTVVSVVTILFTSRFFQWNPFDPENGSASA